MKGTAPTSGIDKNLIYQSLLQGMESSPVSLSLNPMIDFNLRNILSKQGSAGSLQEISDDSDSGKCKSSFSSTLQAMVQQTHALK